jgi:RimJ/RimL family protein N-acetyltransferase
MGIRQNSFGQPIGDAVDIDLPLSPPPTTAMIGQFGAVVPLDVDRHAEQLFAAFTADDEADWTYLAYGPFPDVEGFAHWLDTCARSDDPMFFAVEDDDGPCGMASYLRIEPWSASIEVGHIHFARRLQRSAAATEAMWSMMHRVFEAGYRRYEWKCDALNAPSRAAAERLGFRFEGVFRQATIYKGRNRDTAWYSIIDGQWPAIEAEFGRWLDPGNFHGDGSQRSRLTMPAPMPNADRPSRT